ncbi:hypothetical protein K7X08_012877 [Anisodus acutangulus]|uniref:Transcription repressor n=1 Tax=Anisodus acutangulus TaxID=402998 RepID=A0A9Q1RGZ6_9SOLA|nr:hypothetical protein K7X08_012877 [Anisodus acutangulus]
MENHIVHKFSRFFPSSFTSCQFRNIPDVVDSSIVISTHKNVLGASSRTISSIKTQESKSNKNNLKAPKGFKTHKPNKESLVMKSSSSNSGWFSSEVGDETEDAFFSLSSGYFSESFRRKPAETCRKKCNLKGSEMSRCSSELSVNYVSTALSEKKTNERVGLNLDESKWFKSIDRLDFATSKTEQNRAEISKIAPKKAETYRKRCNEKSSEVSRCSSELSVNSISTALSEKKIHERVGSNLDKSKWFKSINRLDFATSKSEQNSAEISKIARKKAETNRKRCNEKSVEVSRCSSELSVNAVSTALSEKWTNERVGSNLDELKWVKLINGLDFATSKTEQTRGKISKTAWKTAEKQTRSGRRTCRKTAPVEKFDYYNEFTTSDTRRKTTKCRRKIKKLSLTNTNEMGNFSIIVDGRIEESIAVEKSTSDPYSDFRTSMVEMIVEKQIFGLKDLQRLLHCFLSLNSPSFHKIIFEVFSEICETLFH